MTIVESSSKYVENTVGKGEIACYEQFSFSHSVFKRLVLQTCKNKGLFGKGLTLYNTIRRLTTLRKKPFKTIVGKGEIVDNQHFLLFPTMFPHPIKDRNHHFSNISLDIGKCLQFGPGQSFVVW